MSFYFVLMLLFLVTANRVLYLTEWMELKVVAPVRLSWPSYDSLLWGHGKTISFPWGHSLFHLVNDLSLSNFSA